MHGGRPSPILVCPIADLTSRVVTPAHRAARGVERAREGPTGSDAVEPTIGGDGDRRRAVLGTGVAAAELTARVGAPAPHPSGGVESAGVRRASAERAKGVALGNRNRV